MNIREYFDKARKSTVASADAAVFLCAVLGCGKAYLYAHGDEELSAANEAKLALMLEKRTGGMPAAYITGRKEFMGLDFEVGPQVLIPRPETELLVEAVVKRLEGCAGARLLDIGTGSGCVAVSLAHFLKDCRVTAADIDDGALATAARNAARLGAGDRVGFVRADATGDMHELGDARFDAIVSNPPYIRSADIPGLQDGVGRFEPHGALDGGGDGLHFYRSIAGYARRLLKPGGFVAVEIGYDQADDVRKIFENVGGKVKIFKDYAVIDRIAIIDFA